MRTWVMPAAALAVAVCVVLVLLVQGVGRPGTAPAPTWDPGPYPPRGLPAWNQPVFAPAIGALQQWGRDQQDKQEAQYQELELELEWLLR
jgi:hypothetical protein